MKKEVCGIRMVSFCEDPRENVAWDYTNQRWWRLVWSLCYCVTTHRNHMFLTELLFIWANRMLDCGVAFKSNISRKSIRLESLFQFAKFECTSGITHVRFGPKVTYSAGCRTIP